MWIRDNQLADMTPAEVREVYEQLCEEKDRRNEALRTWRGDLSSQIEHVLIERDDLRRQLEAAQAELHDLRIRAGLGRQWREIIACPMCGTRQGATVFREPGQPWAVRVHTCESCAYEIVESEWFVVEGQPATKP